MFLGGYEGALQLVVVFVFLLVASITVFLRAVVRLSILNTFGVDDGLICAAFCFSVAFAALIVKEVQYGQGTSDEVLPHENVVALRHAVWQSVPLYLVALQLTKLSILFSYLRFFHGRLTRRFTVALIYFTIGYGIASVCMTVFICTPVSYFWLQTQPNGRCVSRMAVWFLNASIALLTDALIIILPMPVLSKLNIPKRQKTELISVFAVGSLAFIASVVRLHALYIITTSQDFAAANGRICVLSSIEINVGIACACLPILRSTFIRCVHYFWPPKYDDAIETPTYENIEHGMQKEAHFCMENVSSTLGPSILSSGIMRDVTITTKTERCQSVVARRSSTIPPMDQVWDGGSGGQSWVAIGHETRRASRSC